MNLQAVSLYGVLTQTRRLAAVGFSVLVVLCATSVLTANADGIATPNAKQFNSAPHDLIANTTQQVLAVLETDIDPVKRPQEFIRKLSAVLDPVVAFDYIAGGVMGVYAKQASPEQKKQFTDAFKQGLVNTYGKGVSGFQQLDIEVIPPQSPVGESRQATVLQEVRNGGSANKIAYSMRKTRDGQWKIVNVIFNGINFGQTFRGQFAATANKHNGDLAKVIAEWEKGIGAP